MVVTSSRTQRRPELLLLLAQMSTGSQRRRRARCGVDFVFGWAALRRLDRRRALKDGRVRLESGLLATRGEEVKMGFHDLMLDTIV